MRYVPSAINSGLETGGVESCRALNTDRLMNFSLGELREGLWISEAISDERRETRPVKGGTLLPDL